MFSPVNLLNSEIGLSFPGVNASIFIRIFSFDKLIEDTETQMSLFKNEKEEKLEKLDKVVDELKEKYGDHKITRGIEQI